MANSKRKIFIFKHIFLKNQNKSLICGQTRALNIFAVFKDFEIPENISNVARMRRDTSINENDQNQTSAPKEDTNKNAANEMLIYLTNLNALRFQNRSKCQYINYKSNISSRLFMNSTTGNCFCQTVYFTLNELSSQTNLLYKIIAPMFLGKILYTPNTPAYMDLIKSANSTFENADTLLKLIGSVADLANFTLVSLGLNEEAGVENLKVFVKLIQDLQGNQSQAIDVENLILQIKLVTQVLYFVRNLGYCIELDKFVGYGSEDEAVSVGGDLLANGNMWSVIAFQNTEQVVNDLSVLPNLVKYKIRMNSSLTHNTQYTQDKVYYYGPSNCIGCNAYYTYGFIYMQDMIERGKWGFFGLY